MKLSKWTVMKEIKVCDGIPAEQGFWPAAAPRSVHQRGPAVVVAAVHRGSLPQQEPDQVLMAAGWCELQRCVPLLVRAVHRYQRQHVRAVTLRPSFWPQSALPPGLFGCSGLQDPPGGFIVPLVAGAEEQQQISGDTEIHVFISVSSQPRITTRTFPLSVCAGLCLEIMTHSKIRLSFKKSSSSFSQTLQPLNHSGWHSWNFRYNLLTTKQLCSKLPAQPRFRYFCGIEERAVNDYTWTPHGFPPFFKIIEKWLLPFSFHFCKIITHFTRLKIICLYCNVQ